MRANASIAKSCQVPQILMPDNGNVIRLFSGKAEVIADVTTNALVVDGKQLTPLNSNALKDRGKVLYNGSIFATQSFWMTMVRATGHRFSLFLGSMRRLDLT